MNKLNPEKISQIKQIIHEKYNEVILEILFFCKNNIYVLIFFKVGHQFSNQNNNERK
jgi:hypothetical protein